ncbi:hypothetical protein ACFPM3_12805 [Streptomyces coeruleoprunus]|uniref:DUF4232 domain-containing protein n=1 Tax=Streptomyces coeruleoprunus TaxID=285563 RepID=A0ABV9XCI7_9ACTN
MNKGHDGHDAHREHDDPGKDPALDTTEGTGTFSPAGGHGDGAGADGPDIDGPDIDELALRRMLQGAVADLRPSTGALEHLHRAVPARRARKRQALVGVAAAALLFGTGVPAFVHVAGSEGPSDRPVNAGHGEQVQGGTGDDTGGSAGEQVAGSPSGELGTDKGDKDQKDKPRDAAGGATDGTVGGTADPATSAPATMPVCEPGQLGVISAEAGRPDGDGKVYGTFRIANVSSTDCAIDGPGRIDFRTGGAADSSRIGVVAHSAGDPAGGLPDPGQAVDRLALKPSTAYEVKFAWVPKDTCPVNGGGGSSPDPSPTPTATPSQGGTTEGGTDTGTATEPQLATEEGVQEGSVTVTHTTQPGAPSAEATIPNACAGTIYTTGLLPAE